MKTFENKTVVPCDIQNVSDGYYLEFALTNEDAINGVFVQITVAAVALAVSPCVLLHGMSEIDYVSAETGDTYFDANTSADATEVIATGVGCDLDFTTFKINKFLLKPGETFLTKTLPDNFFSQLGLHIKDTSIRITDITITRRGV